MKKLSTLSVLKAARELIAEEDHWNQGDYALDSDGMSVGPTSYRAYSRCAVGALCAATKRGAGRVQFHPAYALLSESFFVPDFNDSHTHAEVLALFDKAISKEMAGDHASV